MNYRTAKSRLTALIFLFLLFVPLPFIPEYGANTLTRLMLTTVLVEEDTTNVDTYAHLTIDRALIDGRYYADKAPGLSLIAVPAYAAGRWVANTLDERVDLLIETPHDIDKRVATLDGSAGTVIFLRLVVWLTVGVLFATAGAAFFRVALRLGFSVQAAILALISVFVGTPFLGWSAQFFGHVAAGCSLFLAFASCTAIRPTETKHSSALLSFAAGLLLSVSVSIEYTSAIPCLLIAGYAAWRLIAFEPRPATLLFVLGVSGAFVGILPTLIYNAMTFGSAFSVGYMFVDGFEGMNEGFLGLTYPDPKVVIHILFGTHRGILWLSPVLLIVPVATVCAYRVKALRPELILSTSIIAYYICLNASYYYWHGGGSLGPRHILPCLPFAGLAFLWAWSDAKGAWRNVMIGLLGLSIAISILTALVRMTVRVKYPVPLYDPLLQSFPDQNAFVRWSAILDVSNPWLLAALWIVTTALAGRMIWMEAGRLRHISE